jgi:alpha-1,6-mannosyltransferase
VETLVSTRDGRIAAAGRFLAGLTPTSRLALLTAASIVLYGLALSRPYSLLTWVGGVRQTLGTITDSDPLKGLGFVAIFVGAFVLYGLALRTVEGHSTRRLWLIVIGGTLAFSLIFVLLDPFEAADIFDNIIRGRMQARYRANPFYQVPADFSRDPLYKYAYWKEVTSAYGPLWEIVAAGGAFLADDTVLGNILVFKGLSVAAYLLTAVVIVWGLQHGSAQRTLYGVVLYAWNPLVLYAVAGNAHNDSLMVLFVVLGFVLIARRRYVLAGLAELAGALVKFIPVLLLPIVVVAALKELPGLKPRLRYLFVTAIASALLVAAAYTPYWHGGDILNVVRRTTLFTTSAPTLLQIALDRLLARGISQQIAAYIALIVVVAGLIWQVLVLWRSDSADAPVQAGLNVLLIYLLIACLWFQPWYIVWPLGLAALLPNSTLTRGTLLFSLAAMLKFPFFHFMLVRGQQPVPPRAWREPWLTLLTLGPAWLYFAVLFLQRRWPGRSSQPVKEQI